MPLRTPIFASYGCLHESTAIKLNMKLAWSAAGPFAVSASVRRACQLLERIIAVESVLCFDTEAKGKARGGRGGRHGGGR